MGMKFGLWFEPEMANEKSDLYRNHPEYALQTPNKKPALGRNQLVLDLCNPKVRDHIVENVTRILDSAKVDYVKWDYNRHLSDACSPYTPQQGRFFHTYIMGLYEVLDRIFQARPHILFESCSSGGNRFDLGMLCYSPQVWTSDDTDPIERLSIQGGISYLYPLSTMGAHVSEAPHSQTLRNTPLATRFNVSAFGCLGYELDLKYLTNAEMKEVKQQISFYKKHRRLFQYGKFWRGDPYKDNKVVWHVTANQENRSDTPSSSSPTPYALHPTPYSAITGLFQTQTKACETFDRLRFMGLEPERKYSVKTHPQRMFIGRFGGLVKHILPVALNPNGLILRTVGKFYSLEENIETYTAYGQTLTGGIILNNQYEGTGLHENMRILGDFGSNLYIVQQM